MLVSLLLVRPLDVACLAVHSNREMLSDIIEFERKGHVCTRGLLPGVDALHPEMMALTEKEMDATKEHMLKMNDDMQPPFLQFFNPHRSYQIAADLAFSQTLSETAHNLLGADSLRLYQSCLFWKRSGDSPTNWHSDLRTSPIDTNRFVTAWIPLVEVPDSENGGTGLCYADGSHSDLARSIWYHDCDDTDGRYELSDHGHLRPGDVSWHHGWTLHSAADNALLHDRLAFTVSYFADGAMLLDDYALNNLVITEDAPSYEPWIADCGPGDVLDHPMLPYV